LFRDNADRSQYELETDAGLAFMTYRDSPRGHRVLVHTEVPPAMQGLGVGSRLVKAVLDDARAHGRPIVPACEFVKSYLERHPEYADVVAGRV
jgi:predicted GNAT family acetyltransferase